MSGKLIEELRANAAAHPLDVRQQVLADAADALESQAREIERLQSLCDHNKFCAHTMSELCDSQEEELADLKAQPGGVVLPEPLKRGDEGGSGEYGAAMIRGYNACLRAVARLNSSPVSAGGVDERARRALRKIMEAHRFNASGMSVTEVHAICFDALTALAPNHSEQVRDMRPLRYHADKIFNKVNAAAEQYGKGQSALGLMEDIAESALILRNGLDDMRARQGKAVGDE